MAKSKSFFGLRRGSTKSLTFSVYEGQQVTKDRVTEVKNPRTPSQMQQRMIMATALAMYSAGKEIFDHSFQGVTYGAKSMNKFLADNVKLIRENILASGNDFQANAYGNKAALAGSFKLSEGTLPEISQGLVSMPNDGAQMGIKIGIGEAIKVSDVKAYLGLTDGDFFTLIGLRDGNSVIAVGAKEQVNASVLCFVRFYIPVGEDNTTITAENFASLFTPEYRNCAGAVLASSGTGATTSWTVTVNLSASLDVYTQVVACIKSAKVNGVWARSTAFWDFSRAGSAVNYDEALSTYPLGQDYVLNGGDVE